jgi:hypothetical protein
MNIQKLKKAYNSREHKIYLKGYKPYCVICNRRAGIFHAYCGPLSNKRKRNWKKFRKNQYIRKTDLK